MAFGAHFEQSKRIQNHARFGSVSYNKSPRQERAGIILVFGEKAIAAERDFTVRNN